MHHMDVKSAFLNGPLEEEVYVSQPPGFEIKGSEEKVYRLNKALYGLKQAPRAWNRRIDGFLMKLGFLKCTTEHGVYIKGSNTTNLTVVCLYVDDLLVTGNNETEIANFKGEMMREFEMTDLDLISYFLGIEFKRTDEGVIMHQGRYARDVLKKFRMVDCNSADTPTATGVNLVKDPNEEEVDVTLYRQMVGSLRYLCCTRPDLLYVVGLISRYMENPKLSHFRAAKRIMRYVKGTLDYGILFPSAAKKCNVLGYSDSDWCGDKSDRKSTTGYVFFYGDAPISWSSKKEQVVALSSCEAEYIAAAMAACQAQWLDNIFGELKMKEKGAITLMVDNKSAINLAKHPVAHGRSKHIETRFHFLREQVTKGKLSVKYCPTTVQVADIFTKPLKIDQFKELRSRLGVIEVQ